MMLSCKSKKAMRLLVRSPVAFLAWGTLCYMAGTLQSFAQEPLRKLVETISDEPSFVAATQYPSDSSSVWDVKPLERTIKHREVIPGINTDTFNPFHNYFYQLYNKKKEGLADFPELPLFHSWIHFMEPYHNHMNRFRGKEVVFMEIGVQSGGKIPLLRDYIGPGLTYVGIDINPSTKMFESDDWVHIEIGDSSDPEFLKQIKEKYPVVDIFLDDGGHTMTQQMVAMEEMLPHVQPEGVYICEDLSTSWSPRFGGVKGGDVRSKEFLDKTMAGLVHKTLDWLSNGWIRGGVMKEEQLPKDYYPETWWRAIPEQVKHIHYYNQLVVYEKGLTYAAQDLMTVGFNIPYTDSGVHDPVNWDQIMKKLKGFTDSAWEYK